MIPALSLVLEQTETLLLPQESFQTPPGGDAPGLRSWKDGGRGGPRYLGASESFVLASLS